MAGSADEVTAEAAREKKLADLEKRVGASEAQNKSLLDEINILKTPKPPAPSPEKKEGFFDKLFADLGI